MAVGGQADLTTGTLDGLELRLRRLEHLITGQSSTDAAVSATQDERVTTRLERLETSLRELSSKTPAIRDFLELHKAHPDLFPTSSVPPTSSFTPREQLATINASATAFSSTASQLTSVQDSPVPSAESSASLVALQPRLAAAGQKQAMQSKQLAELRLRTAKVLERWYDVTVMGSNECWAEWDQRLTEAERTVRQEEARRDGAEGPV